MTTTTRRRRRTVYEDPRAQRRREQWVGVLRDGDTVAVERRETEAEARRAIGMRPRRTP